MYAATIALAFLSLCGTSIARPAPVGPAAAGITAAPSLNDRSLISDLEGVGSNILGDVVSNIDDILSQVGAGQLSGNAAYSSLKSALVQVTATTTQTAAGSAISALSAIHSAAPSANIYEFAASLVAEGLTANSVTDLLGFVDGLATGENSMSNINSAPKEALWPKKSGSQDPNYTIAESSLRSAIYIPATFTYGEVPPVILVPGTGSTGYYTFIGNFIPLLTGSSYADPVWLNIPGYLLNDAQTNAEYAAYAINYINSVTSKNVSTIAWSQGNIDVQWAFKYFTSTQEVTSDHIAISPDYAGTVEADFVCPDGLPCDPAVYQQQYKGSSNFIDKLRSTDGDSAYVPTTVLYSGLFDEIVEPQQGTGASAYLNDVRGAGVTNNEVQTICPSLPGGSFYTHEGMLYNPIAFALAVDALTHSGPGQVSRIDTQTLCNQYLATGLNVGDLLITENTLVIALFSLILYEPKVTAEPAIMSYATY